jgi:hypothetical protein
MAVRRVVGEMGRYFVHASSGEVLVDICACKGNGWCGCEDFAFRHLPAWERGEDGVHRCKHLRAARDWELDEGIRIWNLANPQVES